MFIKFLMFCYVVGIISTIGIGPIFVLTFNRAAIYGFWKGFATAIGSSVADGILFAAVLNSRSLPVVLYAFSAGFVISEQSLGWRSLSDC